MTDAQDTLENRLEHAQILVDTFLSAEMNERITPRLADGLLYSLRELLEQATDAFQEMCQQSKPDAPVMIHGKPIDDVEGEALTIMREIVEELENTLMCPRQLLKAIDKRDEAA